MKLPGIALLLIGAVGSIWQAHAGSALGPQGMWVVRDGRAKVRVENCGQALCGRIVWLQEPKDENGEPLTDGNNSDPALRNRPIIGLPIAYDMVPQQDGYWTGVVYDPERGSAYDGSMTLLPDGRMKVTGCLAGFLCESNYWQRSAR